MGTAAAARLAAGDDDPLGPLTDPYHVPLLSIELLEAKWFPTMLVGDEVETDTLNQDISGAVWDLAGRPEVEPID